MGNNSNPVGELAVIAQLKEVEFMQDGRCMIEASLVSRHRISSHFIEESTQGLHFCTVENLCDDPVSELVRTEIEEKRQRARGLVASFRDIMGSSQMEQAHGAEPSASDIEGFSLWLISITKISAQGKLAMLGSTNTLDRLNKGIAELEPLIERMRVHKFCKE